KDWAGYYAVCSYDTTHEREYFAFREAAGLIDVTPLYKYEVYGPDAAALLSRMMVRNVRKLKVGRVGYTCWCDDAGKVVDDGTVSRLEKEYFRVTAADPTYHWLQSLARGYDVTIEDSTRRLAAVALQGPTSRDILNSCCEASLDKLRFFRVKRTRLDGLDVWITRTGYTGDLGYEVWVESGRAVELWDTLIASGRPYGIEPAGLDALDMTRIEAGFVMLHVDYFSSTKVTLESRKSTPYEIGLGWAVKLEREPFLGQAALRAEREKGSVWQLAGLEMDWPELEALYERFDLPPALPAGACREPLPVYDNGRQVGQVTSHTWSPILKRMIALASVRTPWAAEGRRLQVEHTVEYERHTVSARVTPTPFFDPPRKRSIVKAGAS
ncbi:MAG: aminomethyltransferase family protein, partial [Thermoanaerobaculia bacterium]